MAEKNAPDKGVSVCVSVVRPAGGLRRFGIWGADVLHEREGCALDVVAFDEKRCSYTYLRSCG